ncbi:MAG: hypothetical protein CSA60_01450 [Neptuniibacter caesariensis]|uniref:Uncharacterized protein n=1 Tax=Neptuniibacter caesariensis TaxID=207954 RepID=A0A2G6JRB1_NEPCE|nr:MAG: hypothetical protein CSA60_01450 [Neptuniibacter caesariensis]
MIFLDVSAHAQIKRYLRENSANGCNIRVNRFPIIWVVPTTEWALQVGQAGDTLGDTTIQKQKSNPAVAF